MKPAGWAEGTLWLLAAVCAGTLATSTLEARATQHQADRVLAAASGQAADAPPIVVSASSAGRGQLLGRLEIASLGLSVPVLEDCDSPTLRRGVGHVPGTAVAGGLGNMVLAGHRDTFFRPLRRIAPGMEIRLVAPSGRWRYVVDRTEVVQPEQTSILGIGDVPEMTLITCYPFEFIGAAPRRFIVHAHLVSAEAT